MRRLVLSLFGVGRVPGLPGTYASAVTAAALAGVVREHVAGWPVAALAAFALGTVATLLLAGPEVAASDDGDPSWIVTDEVAGMGLAVALAYAVPGGRYAPCAAAFLLFRVFDIGKPGPIRSLERLPGALGVLADDLGAGLVAGALVAGARALGVFDVSFLSW